MANLDNFQQNPNDIQGIYDKYTISRVVTTNKDDLLDIEVPVDMEYYLASENTNIEISLYTTVSNRLIYHNVIPNKGNILRSDTLAYSDGSIRTLVYIDFSKLEFDLPVGTYSVSLNFFRNEIGSNDNRVLEIRRISPSRQEVELKLTNLQENQKLVNFTTPGIPVEWIEPTIKQIFSQSMNLNIEVPTVLRMIDSASVFKEFTTSSAQNLVTYGFTEDAAPDKPGIFTLIKQVCDLAYPVVLEQVKKDMEDGETRFTGTKLETYVLDAISDAYQVIYDDSRSNPQNYRYKLI